MTVAILALLVSLLLPLVALAGESGSTSDPSATESGYPTTGWLRPLALGYPLLGSEPILW